MNSTLIQPHEFLPTGLSYYCIHSHPNRYISITPLSHGVRHSYLRVQYTSQTSKFFDIMDCRGSTKFILSHNYIFEHHHYKFLIIRLPSAEIPHGNATLDNCPCTFTLVLRLHKKNSLARYIGTHTLMEKNYSKLFGESLFKTIKNCSHYSPMLNWRTIGGTIEMNKQKLLKCSNYSPMLNYMCRRGDALI